MFRRIVNTPATAAHTAGHGDCEGDGVWCCCLFKRSFSNFSRSARRCSTDGGVPLGCAVPTGNGIAGPAVTVGFACGGGDDFVNLLHSTSRSACVASRNAGFPSDVCERVPTKVQNRSEVSVTSG